jgi:uncharacterized membrane protein
MLTQRSRPFTEEKGRREKRDEPHFRSLLKPHFSKSQNSFQAAYLSSHVMAAWIGPSSFFPIAFGKMTTGGNGHVII